MSRTFMEIFDDMQSLYEELQTKVVKEVVCGDKVDVVRCKDCKWSDWYTTVDGHTYCYCMETGNGGRTENDYCSYGEREDGEA